MIFALAAATAGIGALLVIVLAFVVSALRTRDERRDRFAAEAMHAFLLRKGNEALNPNGALGLLDDDAIAQASYEVADAMLREAAEKRGEPVNWDDDDEETPQAAESDGAPAG